MRVCHQCGAAAQSDDRFCATCGAALFSEGSSGNADPLVGRVIGGNYVLQEIVGVGGMGRVYRAEQTTLGRTVAIKVIHPHLLGDEQTVARFYTEARASSRLNHPNSVSVIDFGRTDDGILYLAMEFLRGKDLAMVMHEEGPLPFPRICSVLVGMLDALGEAHALDIVHRDLKPENVIVRKLRTGQDLVKVVDFGLATIVGGGGTSITRPGLVCGTPDYMSPEQGKGETIDGRGDLYAVGVVLYELLTDELPFEAETPTKVVLRHINDPIPDPRVTAPHRGVPDVLADIAIKALAKRADDRYQSAAEMAAELRRAADALAANRDGTTRTCPACSATNPTNMKFCGSCGTRIGDDSRRPTSPTPKKPIRSFYPPTDDRGPLVGRDEELARLDALRREATGRFLRAEIVGEHGVGKTRLMHEAAGRFAEAGDLVAGAGPLPFYAPVPYTPIRTIVAGLLQVAEDELSAVARDAGMFADPMTRAGLSELGEPKGLIGSEHPSRAGAVCEALATAVRIASSREQVERVVLMIDDYSRCDGLTREVIDRLPDALDRDSVLLLTADLHGHTDVTDQVALLGLTLEQASEVLGEPPVEGAPEAVGRRLLPLYLDQIREHDTLTLDPTLPPRLADAVAQRVERLTLRAQRALQVISAFGGRCDLGLFREVAAARDVEGLEELRESNLVQITGTTIEAGHRFVAELVEAFIPAAARKDLHTKILAAYSERSAPLEVRAEHAYRADEPMRTLMTLERMGDVAMTRGDPATAVLAFQRAVELARRETLESGDTVMDTATVTFSRKLGLALAKTGELAHADGVVREVLDLTNPYDSARARMHLVLGTIASLRDRNRDAMRHYGQALEICAGVEPEVEGALQVALGDLRLQGGDATAASNAFRRALEVQTEMGASSLVRATSQLRLAHALEVTGDFEAAEEHAKGARKLAEDADAPALEARAAANLGRVYEAMRRSTEARLQYEDAARMAAEAGDADGFRAFTDASLMRETSDPPPPPSS